MYEIPLEIGNVADAPFAAEVEIGGPAIDSTPTPADVVDTASVEQASQEIDDVLFPPVKASKPNKAADDGVQAEYPADTREVDEEDEHPADEHMPDAQTTETEADAETEDAADKAAETENAQIDAPDDDGMAEEADGRAAREDQ